MSGSPTPTGGSTGRRACLVVLGASLLPNLATAAAHDLTADPSGARDPLVPLASADRSWVQVAVSADGRRFVNFSRWFGPLPIAVAELHPDGQMTPFPDARFNSQSTLVPAAERAISVQSVVCSPDGRSLWLVDAGNPQLSGPVPGGAKLVQVDLRSNRIARTILLDADTAPPGSYVADMRIDARRGLAVLPDLALGALVVVDLRTGRGWRHLQGHWSTAAEDLQLVFDRKPWLMPDGSQPRTAVTSIAISPDGQTLFYKALVGNTLYRVPMAAMANPSLDPASEVRKVLDGHPSDAMNFGPDGALYMTAIDRQAITRVRPAMDGWDVVLTDARLAWPVGLSFGPDGMAYTTVGRIHEGLTPRDRYRLYRCRLAS